MNNYFVAVKFVLCINISFHVMCQDTKEESIKINLEQGALYFSLSNLAGTCRFDKPRETQEYFSFLVI